MILTKNLLYTGLTRAKQLAYQAECSMVGRDAWSIHVNNPFYLESPVYDVLLPNNINEGDIWSPQEQSYIEAFRLALQYES